MSESLPPLYVVTDAGRLGEERVRDSIRSASEGGLSMVQLREPSWSVERLEAFGRSLLDRAAGLSLVVSCHAGDDFTSRMELADRLGARGVHVGGGETGRAAEARETLGEDMLIGYSAHSAAEAADAFEQGASYVSLSPVFLPLSKTGEFQPLGLEELGRACSRLPGPVYALGGVTPAAASSIKDMGAAGVAVITAILEADDPAGVSRRIQAPWGDRAAG